MLQRADNTLVLGSTGSGKTHLVNSLVQCCERVIMFDTTGHDYSDGVVFDDLMSFKKFWEKVYRLPRFRLIYRPLNEVEEFQEICRLAYLCGNLTLVAEELDIFCRSSGTPVEVKTILKRGRHRDIRFIGVSQRPKGIDRDVTSQAKTICIFHLHEPDDIDYLKRVVGSGVEQALKELREYDYIQYSGKQNEFEIRRV